jgi:hypothetical protein
MDNRHGKRATNTCMEYMLNKYRDTLMRQDNNKRREALRDEYLTLRVIQEIYCSELELHIIEYSRFDEYLRNNFVRVYDANLNHLGYERRTS